MCDFPELSRRAARDQRRHLHPSDNSPNIFHSQSQTQGTTSVLTFYVLILSSKLSQSYLKESLVFELLDSDPNYYLC